MKVGDKVRLVAHLEDIPLNSKGVIKADGKPWDWLVDFPELKGCPVFEDELEVVDE